MRQCERCEKSYSKGRKRKKLRGHYNPTPSKRKQVNLLKTKLLVPGKTSKVCSKCLRTLTKNATVSK